MRSQQPPNKKEELEKIRREIEHVSNLMARYRWGIVVVVLLTAVVTILQLLWK